MRTIIVSLIIISSVLPGCASVVGGTSSPQDLMTKKVAGEYITEYEMIETFDCLARWVGSKNPIGLRREITDDGLQGHLFWKDNFGWANWTFLFKKAVNGAGNTLSLFVSANVSWHAGYLKDSASECVADASSWPDSDF